MWGLLGIKHSLCAASHPQGNPLAERFNRYLGASLYAVVSATQKDWDVRLWEVLFAYRTSVNPTTAETPYFLLYGRDPVLPEDMIFAPKAPELLDSSEGDVAKYIREMVPTLRSAYKKVSLRLEKFAITERLSVQPNRRPAPELKAGNQVMVTQTEQHRKGESTKFESRASGPFKVLEQVSQNTWRLLHSQTGYQWVVNVDRIIPYEEWRGPIAVQEYGISPESFDSMMRGEESDDQVPAETPAVSSEEMPQAESSSGEKVPFDPDRQWQVEKILDRRFANDRFEWLVDWGKAWKKTWEPLDSFQSGSDGVLRLLRQFEKGHPYRKGERKPYSRL